MVNVRTGPGINYPVTEVLPKARSVAITATTSNGYTQLTDGRWISTAWITRPPATPALTTPRHPHPDSHADTDTHADADTGAPARRHRTGPRHRRPHDPHHLRRRLRQPR